MNEVFELLDKLKDTDKMLKEAKKFAEENCDTRWDKDLYAYGAYQEKVGMIAERIEVLLKNA